VDGCHSLNCRHCGWYFEGTWRQTWYRRTRAVWSCAIARLGAGGARGRCKKTGDLSAASGIFGFLRVFDVIRTPQMRFPVCATTSAKLDDFIADRAKSLCLAVKWYLVSSTWRHQRLKLPRPRAAFFSRTWADVVGSDHELVMDGCLFVFTWMSRAKQRIEKLPL
jgi:hypothetical protein